VNNVKHTGELNLQLTTRRRY